MSSALQALLDWAEEHLAPSTYRAARLPETMPTPSRSTAGSDSWTMACCRCGGARAARRSPSNRLRQRDTADPDAFFLRMVYRPRRAVDTSRMILTAGPSISAREASYALDAARNGWNRRVERLPRAIRARLCGVPRRQARDRHVELHRRASSGAVGARRRPRRRGDRSRPDVGRHGQRRRLPRGDAGLRRMSSRTAGAWPRPPSKPRSLAARAP